MAQNDRQILEGERTARCGPTRGLVALAAGCALLLAVFAVERYVRYIGPMNDRTRANLARVEEAIRKHREIVVVYRGERYRLEAVVALPANKGTVDGYLLRPPTGPALSVRTGDVDGMEFDGSFVALGRDAVLRELGAVRGGWFYVIPPERR